MILVCLILFPSVSADTVTVTANIIGVPPIATFIATTPTSGTAPLDVTFTSSLSQGTLPVTYQWAYSTNEITWTTVPSGSPNPTITFSTSGIYSVRLTVSNPYGSSSALWSRYITVTAITLLPATPALPAGVVGNLYPATTITTEGGTLPYFYAVTAGALPTGITLSPAGLISGTPTAAPGTYGFTITATDSAATPHTGSRDYTITVTAVAPVAQFSGTPVSGSYPLNVAFTDASTGVITSRLWNFGDTGTSTEINPSHVYAAAGTYMVTLTVTGPGGTDVESKVDYITVTTPSQPITLTPSSDIPTFVDTNKYSLITTIKATGGAPPYIYSKVGDLPAGLTLDPALGIVSSGAPSAADIGKTFIFTIIATDKEKNSVSQTYTITVTAPSAPEIPGGDDSGPAAGQDAVAQSIESQSLESLGIDLSVNGVSIATGATVTVNGNVVTITTPTFTVVYVSGKITEIQGMLISQDAGSISLSTESVEASIPGVGEVSGSVEAGIDSISDGAEVNLTLAKPEVKDILAFEAAMKKEGKELDAVAFTMTVTKTNITANLPAKITMTVPPDWVARNGGITAVSIVRTADDGTTQVLPTTFAGIDFKTGNFVFEALSKDGLSVFGLVTVKATVTEKAENPNATVVVASKSMVSTDVGMYAWMISELEQNPVILVILLAVVALVAYFGWWKRRL
jgi:PKD repeat protein